VFGAARVTPRMLKTGPKPLANGAFPTVLDSVTRVLLCVEHTMSAATAIWQHDRLWHWIESLTNSAEYHELGFIFVVNEDNAMLMKLLLQEVLGLKSRQKSNGIALWLRTGSLVSLLNAINTVGKRDLQTVRTLRASQPKRQALAGLKAAILKKNRDEIRQSARNVAGAFQREQLAFDNFCNSPCHQNGNAWRRWILRVVTEGVTQELCAESKKLLPHLNL